MERKQKSVGERFWKKVAKTDDADGCWLWTASMRGKGYGIFRRGERLMSAHQVAWELENGCEVPEGMVVMHRCNVKLCCRPDHLAVGTQSKNVRDAYRDGLNGVAKLSPTKVKTLREMVASAIPLEMIAGHFGVTVGAVLHVLKGNTWSWVS